MRGPPGIVVIAPWIGAGLDRDKAVMSVRVSQRSTAACEVGIERGMVLVHRMPVAACRVGLPDFHECVRDRPTIFVQNAAADDDALANRLSAGLARKIKIARLNV